jgi:hypothetical protein
MSHTRVVRYVAAATAAVVLAFGAYALGSSNSGQGSSGAARAFGPPGMGQGGPGFGTAVVGPAAAKVENAALARYPGTVEAVLQLPDGSYVAHVLTSGGEYHVAVSKDFEVTGARQGGRPGAGGAPPGAQAS